MGYSNAFKYLKQYKCSSFRLNTSIHTHFYKKKKKKLHLLQSEAFFDSFHGIHKDKETVGKSEMSLKGI